MNAQAQFYGGALDGRVGAANARTFYSPTTEGRRHVYHLQKYAGLVEGPERKIECAYAWVLEGEEPDADRVMADARARGLATLADFPEDV